MKNKKEKVLVLGSGNRSFLSVIRSLGRKNIEVHVGSCSEGDSALKSRYIKKIFYLPEFSLENNNLMDVLIKILKNEDYNLVIPCDDPSIMSLQLNRLKLLKYAKISLLADECFEIINNKIKVSDLVSKLKINLPREIIYSRKEEIDLNFITIFLGLPIVIKPVSSFFKEDLKNKNLVKIIFNELELKRYLSYYEKALLQQFFIGTGIGLEVLSKNGKIISVFQHVRIHEPIMGGGSTYRKSVKINPELLDAARKLIKELNYNGVAMIEFKYNLNTGKWVFIEINGRFWGSLPLALAVGMDFPYYLYELLVKNKENVNQKYQKDIYCRNLILDLSWIFNNFKTDKLNPYLNTLPNLKVFSEIKNIISFKERSDTFVYDDLLPAFYEILQLFNSFIKRVKIKIRNFIESSILMKKIKKRQVYRKLIDLKSIVFVCKGNICRSPFAEKVARKLLPKSINISSKGILNLMNKKPPYEAIQLSKRLGYPISNHGSKVLDENDLRNSDLIFIFDRYIYLEIMRNYAHFKDKTFYLGIFSKGSVVIEDPINKKLNHYKITYEKIIQSIINLKKRYYVANQ